MTRTRKPSDLRPYTTGEIARELGLNPSTVHKMMVRGDLPHEWNARHTVRLVPVSVWRQWKRDHT